MAIQFYVLIIHAVALLWPTWPYSSVWRQCGLLLYRCMFPLLILVFMGVIVVPLQCIKRLLRQDRIFLTDLFRPCLTTMTYALFKSDTLRSVSSKTASYAYEAILEAILQYCVTSSPHHFYKLITSPLQGHSSFSEDSVPTLPLCHMSTRITTESLELTKQCLDTVIIQSRYTAHHISSSKPISFAQLTGGGVL